MWAKILQYIGLPLIEKLGAALISWLKKEYENYKKRKQRQEEKKQNQEKAKEYVKTKDNASTRDDFNKLP